MRDSIFVCNEGSSFNSSENAIFELCTESRNSFISLACRTKATRLRKQTVTDMVRGCLQIVLYLDEFPCSLEMVE